MVFQSALIWRCLYLVVSILTFRTAFFFHFSRLQKNSFKTLLAINHQGIILAIPNFFDQIWCGPQPASPAFTSVQVWNYQCLCFFWPWQTAWKKEHKNLGLTNPFFFWKKMVDSLGASAVRSLDGSAIEGQEALRLALPNLRMLDLSVSSKKGNSVLEAGTSRNSKPQTLESQGWKQNPTLALWDVLQTRSSIQNIPWKAVKPSIYTVYMWSMFVNSRFIFNKFKIANRIIMTCVPKGTYSTCEICMEYNMLHIPH